MNHHRVVATILLALVGPACGSGAACGPGTVEQDGECVPSDPVVCGSGTVEDDGTCVVPDAAPGLPPIVTSIDPTEEYVGGGTVFTITGSGFQAPGAGQTTVTFGDALASFQIESDTRITGTIPRATARNVAVTVANQHGYDAIDFGYTGLAAADGRGGVAGSLYLLDPRDGTALAIGPVASGGGATGHAVTGMEYDETGALFAVESTNGGNTIAEARLLSIDPGTGAATVIGQLDDATNSNHRSIADVTFAGSTLVGWTEGADDAVTIDTGTGAVTVLGNSGVSSFGGGLVTLGDGTIVLAGAGAQGPTFAIDSGTGTASPRISLDGPTNGSVSAMTRHRGTVYAVISGHLATVDPASGEVVLLGPVPGGIDAIASDIPDGTAAARVRSGPRHQAAPACRAHGWAQVSLRGTPRAPVLAAQAAAQRLDLADVFGAATSHGSSDAIVVVACDGESRLPAASVFATPDRWVLAVNQRGQLKLLDAVAGRTIARGVTGLHLVP